MYPHVRSSSNVYGLLVFIFFWSSAAFWSWWSWRDLEICRLLGILEVLWLFPARSGNFLAAVVGFSGGCPASSSGGDGFWVGGACDSFFFLKKKKIQRVKRGFRSNVLLNYANVYFSCLMLMCQYVIGGQKLRGFCHCLVEVIPNLFKLCSIIFQTNLSLFMSYSFILVIPYIK